MYQSIDDEPDEYETRGFAPGLLLLLGVLGAAAVFVLVYLTSPGSPTDRSDPLQPEPEARAVYLRAIGETDAALRRARLSDFLNTHPQDPRAPAAQAQLYVLDAEESRVWERTVRAAYDGTRTKDERRAAVEAFRADWGRFLGARDAEIEALLAEIDESREAVPKPNRALPNAPSPFPDSVPADRLAGGPITRAPEAIIYEPVEPEPIAPRRVEPTRVAEITPPRVRRNVTPRYPRKAQRRGIDGVVTLALNIDDRGRVAMAEVVSVQAENYADDFVRAAERAAMRTRFHPKTVDGEAVAAMGVRKRYRFESRRGRR